MNSFADTAEMIAANTGGRAFYNTNDLSGAIRRAVDDARVTYLIGYSPSQGEWNGRFREIKVKVNRPGLEVRHRKGYLAFPLPEANKGRLGSIIAKAVDSPLQAAGIAVSVRLERAGGPANRDVNLAIRVDAKAITFEQKADTFKGTIALTVAQSDAQGRVFKDFERNVDFNLTREVRDQWLSEGVVLNRKITLRDDVHELRVVVGDLGTMATGSVVIPVVEPARKTSRPRKAPRLRIAEAVSRRPTTASTRPRREGGEWVGQHLEATSPSSFVVPVTRARDRRAGAGRAEGAPRCLRRRRRSCRARSDHP